MKKGFTLMEILAVLLVIAVIASFAMPALRSIQAEVRHQRAKSAALKMADAMRTYYKNSKGWLLDGSVKGTDNSLNAAVQTTCDTDRLQGLYPSPSSKISVYQLFACGLLSSKDFWDLPYEFAPATNPFDDNEILLNVTGKDKKAGKYQNKVFKVTRGMEIIGDDTDVEE